MFVYIFTLILLALVNVTCAIPIESRAITSFNGVTYTARNPDGSCQTTTEIMNAVKQMKSDGISSIRTYSQECNLLPNILKAIQTNGGGMTVLAAVWIDGTSNDDVEITRLKTNLKSSSDTSSIRGILVGNEVLFKNQMSSSQLIQKIKTVKAISGGIPVGSAETDATYSNDLMAASDFIGVNIHPFFAEVSVNDAYNNLVSRFNAFKSKAGGKKVYITETGWPSEGSNDGSAQPSLANTKTFATTISKSSLPYYYFEWEDSAWKASGTESHFGLLNSNAVMAY
ncbi:MAG: glycoside hydrolase superfamily [Benjaminiella poitrasii]|nr:MAG: glycoside hydrolase superfamily [Benjaminiella poitrasii]